MHREEIDRGVVIENALRSVPVMHVPIDNRHPLYLCDNGSARSELPQRHC